MTVKVLHIGRVHGNVCMFVLSTLLTATKCLIAVASFVDHYGAQLLDAVASRGIKVILIHDEKSASQGSVIKPQKVKSFVIGRLRIHDKVYIAVKDDTILVAVSSANLLQSDLCINSNHYEANIYDINSAQNDPMILWLLSTVNRLCSEECKQEVMQCLQEILT